MIPKRDESIPQNVKNILEWLNTPFENIDGEWKYIHSDVNLYSHTLLFQNISKNQKNPHTMFVKIFPDATERNIYKYEAEKKGLSLASGITGVSNIKSPTVYRYNDMLACIAMEYIKPDEDSIFHYLWNKRRNRLFLGNLPANALLMLRNIGSWLTQFHNAVNFQDTNGDLKKNIIESDLSEIKKRVDYLMSQTKANMNLNLLRDSYIFSCALAEEMKNDKNGTLKWGHGDLTLANILRQSNSLFVIDFAMGGPSFAENDVARMIADLSNVELSFLQVRKKDLLQLNSVSAFVADINLTEYSKRLFFYLIKHSLINLTMYVNYLGRVGRLDKIMFSTLMKNQSRLLGFVVKNKFL